MPIQVQCPGCQAKFRADDKLVGKRVKCPKCSAVIEVNRTARGGGGIEPHRAEKPSQTPPPIPIPIVERQGRSPIRVEPIGAQQARSQEASGRERPAAGPSEGVGVGVSAARPGMFGGAEVTPITAKLADERHTPAGPALPRVREPPVSGSLVKSRVLTGVILLAISALAFLWYSITWDGCFTASGSGGDKPFAYTWLAIGVLAVIGGLFLIAGGPYASRVYSGIGLGSPTEFRRGPGGTMALGQGDTKILVTLLQLSALWHLSFGSFVFGGTVDTHGPQVGAATVCLILYGALPTIFAPFCARRKKGALWSVLILAILTGILVLGILLAAFFIRPSSVRSFSGTYTVWNQSMLFLLGFYSLMTGLAALLAGRSLYAQAREESAGTRGRCPASGAFVAVAEAIPAEIVETPSWAAPVGPPSTAEPPTATITLPTSLPEKFHVPGKPPCWLKLSVNGAVVKADFDVMPVLETLVTAFAKKLKKHYNVCLGAAPADGTPRALVRVVLIDQGNRFLRYFLTFFAGKTCLEVAGSVTGPHGRQVPIQFRHKSTAGVFGGNSLGLLKLDATSVGTQVAKAVLNVAK